MTNCRKSSEILLTEFIAWKLCILTIVFSFSVNYKVELYDPRSGGFMPSSPGIGMHVEVKDPDDKVVLSRVCFLTSLLLGLFFAFPCTAC